MHVADVGVSVVGDRSRISATIESPAWSAPRDVWFEMPSEYLPADPALSGDAWLAAHTDAEDSLRRLVRENRDPIERALRAQERDARDGSSVER